MTGDDFVMTPCTVLLVGGKSRLEKNNDGSLQKRNCPCLRQVKVRLASSTQYKTMYLSDTLAWMYFCRGNPCCMSDKDMSEERELSA